MGWLAELQRTNPTAQAIGVVALVCALGLALGTVRVAGVRVGTVGALFAGILVGAIGHPVNHAMLEFVKEFGLVLFVYCIGLQIGPGFFASFRHSGVRLNGLAATVVTIGAAITPVAAGLLAIDAASAPGILAGATTNTPSLGAAQQTISTLPGVSEERAALPALAYAVTYPFAVVGIIAVLLLLRRVGGAGAGGQGAGTGPASPDRAPPLERRTVVIENPDLDGRALASIAELRGVPVAVSRIRRAGEERVRAVGADATLHVGDTVLLVGTSEAIDWCERVAGRATADDLVGAPGELEMRRVVVTRREAVGKTLEELDLRGRFEVSPTRVARAEVELAAASTLRLRFGDVVQLVGDPTGLAGAAELLGDSVKALNETHFVPLFAGVVAGIALGALPLEVPGLAQPLRLGLAAGPLVVAIVAGRLGRIGPLVWHVPAPANAALREFGIALFFAGVGLLAGPRFFEVVLSERGLRWAGAGALVTVLPILAVGLFAVRACRMAYPEVAGLIAGSMTDPPALAFANAACGSAAPTVSYATVYPLTMLLRILSAQILAVAMCG